MTAEEIYNSLDENEKAGIKFGLFPMRIKDQVTDNETAAALMKIAEQDIIQLARQT